MSKVREESASKTEHTTTRRAKFSRAKPRATSFLGNSSSPDHNASGLSNTEWELIMTNASKVQYLTSCTCRKQVRLIVNRYHNGDLVFNEGIANSSLFRIVQGGVRFEKSGANGPIIIAHLSEGQVFGEMSFLGKNTTSAAAIAESQDNGIIVLSVIETSFIDELFESEHELAATFYKHLAVMVATRLKTTVSAATNKQSTPQTSPTPAPATTPSPSPSPISTPPATPTNVPPASNLPLTASQESAESTPRQQQKASSARTLSSSPSSERKLSKSTSFGSLPTLSSLTSSPRNSPSQKTSENLMQKIASFGSSFGNSNGTNGSANGNGNGSGNGNGNGNGDGVKDELAKSGRVVDIQFGKRFKDLEDRVVIKVYVCKYRISGSLYITKNYLCFYGKMLGTVEKKKVIPWAHVTNLEKIKYLIVERTIAKKKSLKKFLFKTASELDEAYGIMSVIWRNLARNQAAIPNGIAATANDTIQDDDDTSDLSSSSSSIAGNLADSASGHTGDPTQRRPVAVISKNLDLAVEIPGLPNKEDWNVILKGSKAVVFQPGEIIVNEGDKIQKVFQILRGTCVVQKKIPGSDKSLVLSRMGTHDIPLTATK